MTYIIWKYSLKFKYVFFVHAADVQAVKKTPAEANVSQFVSWKKENQQWLLFVIWTKSPICANTKSNMTKGAENSWSSCAGIIRKWCHY